MEFCASKASPHGQNWRTLLSGSLTDAEQLVRTFSSIHKGTIEQVIKTYPMRINPYYLSLIRRQGDPIWLQCVPDPREIREGHGEVDPLDDDKFSPLPGLIHKYPDRVVLLVTRRCAVLCRFCNRKAGFLKRPLPRPASLVGPWVRYIKANPQVRDVILSGGDPLLLSNSELHGILNAIRSIPSVEIIRIGTRVPCTLPPRVTPQLCRLLSGFHPLYIVTHFNHPWELTAEAQRACNALADAGIPLGCQTVLLKGVNDDPQVLRALFQGLLRLRVRPYYLFHLDSVSGALHFKTRIEDDMEILRSLIGHVSGLGIPHYALDLPAGGGKVFLWPSCIRGRSGGRLEVVDFRGQCHLFPLRPDDPFMT